MKSDFLAGVVEGFYGQTWTQDQRFQLFNWMSDWGLNAYFYSPKDDLKHRAIWRELYDKKELGALERVVSASQRHEIQFIYGLSPGLDIRFSEADEIELLKRKYQQLIELGVSNFALLFDDLPGSMTEEDTSVFDSVAAAQCSIANAVCSWIQETVNGRLLFCPTPYCDRMDRWNLGGKGYLDTIGKKLDPHIDFLWTGPEIISEEISVTSIASLAERIGRTPIIWDNLHANDYDMRRHFCGPYSGRSAKLLDHVAGIVANPNNEFWMNFVPLRTMAQFCQTPGEYNPRLAFEEAIREWASHYTTVKETIPLDDLQLIADCYYLPHHDGPEATRLRQLASALIGDPVENWGDKYDEFLSYQARIESLFDRFTQLINRELFYAWSRRIWELREEVDLIRDFLSWKKQTSDVSGGFLSETHLPKTYRGGIVADLQRLLVQDEVGRLRKG